MEDTQAGLFSSLWRVPSSFRLTGTRRWSATILCQLVQIITICSCVHPQLGRAPANHLEKIAHGDSFSLTFVISACFEAGFSFNLVLFSVFQGIEHSASSSGPCPRAVHNQVSLLPFSRYSQVYVQLFIMPVFSGGVHLTAIRCYFSAICHARSSGPSCIPCVTRNRPR